MINAKVIYNTILHDTRLTSIVEKVLDAYPNSITKFPCVIFLDDNQNDTEFADNEPLADNLSVQVHIFTKALSGYKTTTEIGLVVNTLMKENYFACTSNREVPDSVDNVRHRVMYFTRGFYSL